MKHSALSGSLHERVAHEQARIDKLDSLDALARQDTDDVQFVDAVRDVEKTTAGAVLHGCFRRARRRDD